MEVKGILAGSLAGSLAKKLVIFTGKGGVGKTTLAAAFAHAASGSGKRVLLAEARSPRRIPPLFGMQPQTDGPLQLAPGLEWINLTAHRALETYAMQLLRFRSVYRAVFEQKAVRQFLRAVPSLPEILVLGHLVHLLERGHHDLVVLDGPSSGPGTLMFEAPRAVLESAPKGPLRDGAAWIRRLLLDADKTVTHIVVLLEELPVSEAVDLSRRLGQGVGMPLGPVLANRTLEDPFADMAEPAVRQGIEELSRYSAGRPLAEAGRLLGARLRLQQTYLDRLRAGLALAVLSLPEISRIPEESSLVTQLSAHLRAALGGPP